MAVALTWLGHGCWLIETREHKILLDPFLDESPTAPLKSKDLDPDYLLVSHGHFDHIADVPSIANRRGATVIGNYEVTTWLNTQHGVKNVIGMNLGGSVALPFGRVKLTLAHHSSQLPDGTYGGNPGGFLLTMADRKLYFACDTALFADMQLIGSGGLDLAVLPIGDLYTMGPEDSLHAIRLLAPRRVAPSHYNTWPPIHQDVQQWSQRVRAETSAEPIVTTPGMTFAL